MKSFNPGKWLGSRWRGGEGAGEEEAAAAEEEETFEEPETASEPPNQEPTDKE